MSDWQDDIEKYRKGELTPNEMHSLEKRALSDPFLADALEGAESMSPDNFSKDLKELKESIRLQSEEKSVASLAASKRASAPAMRKAAKDQLPSGESAMTNKWVWPLRMAASLLIMIGIFWAANQIIPKEEKESLALKNEEANKQSTKQAKEATRDSVGIEQQPVASPLAKSLVERPKKIVAAKPIETVPNGSGVVAATTVEAEEKQTALLDVAATKETPHEEVVELTKIEKLATAEPVAPLSTKDVGFASRGQESKRKSATAQIVLGQVLSSEDGQPLPGVNVLQQGTTEGTVTDADGKYQVAMEGVDPKLVFSFVGFKTKEVSVGSQKEVNVRLGLDLTQLSEVVVTGAAARDNADRLPVIRLAEPAGGRKAYDKYLESGLRYPVEALTKKVKGRVTVKFTVGIDGGLDEFSVIKSLGYGCDEEVLRLVKEGPTWSPTLEDNVPVESEVLVKVRFDPAKAKQ
jgi:TonB family protein